MSICGTAGVTETSDYCGTTTNGGQSTVGVDHHRGEIAKAAGSACLCHGRRPLGTAERVINRFQNSLEARMCEQTLETRLDRRTAQPSLAGLERAFELVENGVHVAEKCFREGQHVRCDESF